MVQQDAAGVVGPQHGGTGGGFRSALSALRLDSRFRGNDRLCTHYEQALLRPCRPWGRAEGHDSKVQIMRDEV